MGKATQCAALYSESPTDPAESETLCMRGRSMHENREVSAVSVDLSGSVRKGLWRIILVCTLLRSRTAPVVPMKPANKGCGAPRPAERVEGRGLNRYGKQSVG